ncbi:MAG: hypothetical protein OHK0023_18590 [Anaerolineae bacterium]
MPDYAAIYAQHAQEYDALVSCEDYENHLIELISRRVQLYDAIVVESGAGTGRLTRLLHDHIDRINAFDASPHMLEVAIQRLANSEKQNWSFEVATHHALPVPSDSADFFISGWSMCYAYLWPEGEAEASLLAALGEAERVVRRGGCIILLETMGTGCTAPCPPEILAPYFALLQRHGFEMEWFRTDYRFNSRQEAERLTDFFFGEAMRAHLDETPEGKAYLPECTGIWWKYV